MTTLPDLWTDWCEVSGVPAGAVNEAALLRFEQQAGPSRAVVAALRRRMTPEPVSAPAWPREHRRDTASLPRLIRRASAMVQDPGVYWVFRLRLRRMLFAAVLLAPATHGGLGMDRTEALAMRPDTMLRLRPSIGVAADPASCPSCATWSWLQVLGTNRGWSHGAVRALGHRRNEEGSSHRHLEADPNEEWRLCLGMLPAIDRWGWIDCYTSMHPSSLSSVIRAMALLLDGPEPVPAAALELRPTVEHEPITREEEERILARADELTARVEATLRDFGASG
jgi:hypothetical protein